MKRRRLSFRSSSNYAEVSHAEGVWIDRVSPLKADGDEAASQAGGEAGATKLAGEAEASSCM